MCDQSEEEKNTSQVMNGRIRSEAQEVENPVGISNPEVEKQRLEHEKSMHRREERLFECAQQLIQGLFVFAGLFAFFVLIVISQYSASPWLITLASICILTPTGILLCLFQHIYSKDNQESKILKEIIDKAPAIELVNKIFEAVQEILKAKK